MLCLQYFMEDRAVANSGVMFFPSSLTLRQNDLLMLLVMVAVSVAHLPTVGSSRAEHCRRPSLNFNVSLNLGTPLELAHFLCRIRA